APVQVQHEPVHVTVKTQEDPKERCTGAFFDDPVQDCIDWNPRKRRTGANACFWRKFVPDSVPF
ncbi:hypothetical protein A2U01_0077270, partial [Trifolium medium]|nr:hypothetical protein [Trifolium medium]